jgi:hypothetical protein
MCLVLDRPRRDSRGRSGRHGVCPPERLGLAHRPDGVQDLRSTVEMLGDDLRIGMEIIADTQHAENRRRAIKAAELRGHPTPPVRRLLQWVHELEGPA